MTVVKETALVYCQSQFGLADGKTAAALVRHSEIYDIVGVIDSFLAGQDAGEVLGGVKNNIPIFSSLSDALRSLEKSPDFYIYGKAPLETCIPPEERLLVLEAMEHGLSIISGLHQFFSEDPEFSAAALRRGVQIKDIRKPAPIEDLRTFTGQIAKVNVPVVAILGTDCACGKMTTAVELNQALNALGIKSVLVATGQTSLMQGAKYGVSIDALVSQFVIGEIEHAVVQAYEGERPDIILVEGQSAVSHPAFMGSLGILKGSMPDGIILQHPPARTFRCDFPQLPMPTVESEIKLLEAIAASPVLAITLSHENLGRDAMEGLIDDYEQRLGLPTTDVLSHGCHKVIQALIDRFPNLSPILQVEMSEKTLALAMG